MTPSRWWRLMFIFSIIHASIPRLITILKHCNYCAWNEFISTHDGWKWIHSKHRNCSAIRFHIGLGISACMMENQIPSCYYACRYQVKLQNQISGTYIFNGYPNLKLASTYLSMKQTIFRIDNFQFTTTTYFQNITYFYQN